MLFHGTSLDNCEVVEFLLEKGIGLLILIHLISASNLLVKIE